MNSTSISPRVVTREEFDRVVAAIWGELQYQDHLPRRTEDEAKDVPGFATLARRYMRHLEDHWADQPGTGEPPVVEDALKDLRKLATIFTRAMIYCGVRARV